MMRALIPLLLSAAALSLGGCVAGMAASAAGMAVRGARGEPRSNETMQPEAIKACATRGGEYGVVHVIDVAQSTLSKITVFGTVGEGANRRSFECSYGTKVTGFKLRAIPARR